MNWSNITVEQYQKLYPILTNKSDSTLDVLVEVISLIEELSIDEIDSWPLHKLTEKEKEYSFLDSLDFDKTAKSTIKANGKRYHFVHQVEQMPAARYIEAKTFAQGDLVQNLHKIMASCVLPMTKKWYGWYTDKYNAKDHEQYANDLKKANFAEVYNCVVFFCQLYGGWMIISRDYLVSQYKTAMSQERAEELVSSLIEPMAGFLTFPQFQSLKELR